MTLKKILITGITGYIGSNFAREHIDSYEIHGMVRSPLHDEYIKDIKDKKGDFIGRPNARGRKKKNNY